MANIKYTPTWAEHEKDMHSSDADTSLKATEAFIEEREKELKNSEKAKKWESDRKKELFDYKPTWKKKQLQNEQDQSQKIVRNLKDLGAFKSNIKPSNGYILVEIQRKEQTTASGIVLAQEEPVPNTGIVLAIGEPLTTPKGNNIYPPVNQVGTEIIFKKFAGAEVVVGDKQCLLLQFSDVLAEVLND